jgi:osmotically inducible protein OsmC
MPARGSAEWKGDVPTGSGTFTAGDSISGGYTFKSRFEDGPGSNPEQLIAVAHAACRVLFDGSVQHSESPRPMTGSWR